MTQNVTLVRTEAGRAYLAEMMNGDQGICVPMRRLVAEEGDVYALVPNGTTAKRVEQFEAGGLMAAIIAENFVVERIGSHYDVDKPSVLLVEDIWATPEDYLNPRAVPSFFAHDGSIYLYAATDQADDLRRCIRLPISFNHVCYLIPNSAAAQQFRDGSRTIEALAPEIAEIYVPAYDDESFVIWSRAG